MTAEEARELFSEAFEGELSPERKAAFEEAVQNDPALQSGFQPPGEHFRLVAGLIRCRQSKREKRPCCPSSTRINISWT